MKLRVSEVEKLKGESCNYILIKIKDYFKMSLVVVVHAINPSAQGAEAVWSLSSRPTSSADKVPGQPGIHRKSLSPKQQIKA